MKKVLFLIFVLQSAYGFTQNSSCENFKNGVFRAVDGEIDDETYRIIRNDSVQIERDEKYGIEIIQSIEWITECSFRLKFLSANKVYQEKYSTPNDTIPLIIEIKIAGANFYSYEARYEGKSKVMHAGNILKLE
ncbi:hypothetical protein POV27_07335 [Aureisphaera galaxeae]|uniref:hypothetical protein n=1 Tax=Aureisphaera galaxeae TaxID=1538023 RepID=UPI0023505374|nr:hypothetical protein [Aureisphaera galaxeae]MDC8003859.1 hypothetical protein [Aureisphaera galaxeae]